MNSMIEQMLKQYPAESIYDKKKLEAFKGTIAAIRLYYRGDSMYIGGC